MIKPDKSNPDYILGFNAAKNAALCQDINDELEDSLESAKLYDFDVPLRAYWLGWHGFCLTLKGVGV